MNGEDRCLKSCVLKLIKTTNVYSMITKKVRLDTQALEESGANVKTIIGEISADVNSVAEYGATKGLPADAKVFAFEGNVVVIKQAYNQAQIGECHNLSNIFEFTPFVPTRNNFRPFLNELKDNQVSKITLRLFPHNRVFYNIRKELVVELAHEDFYSATPNQNFDEDSLMPILVLDLTKSDDELFTSLKWENPSSPKTKGLIACVRPIRTVEYYPDAASQLTDIKTRFKKAKTAFESAWAKVVSIKNTGTARNRMPEDLPLVKPGILENFLPFAKYAADILGREMMKRNPSASWYRIMPLITTQLYSWAKQYSGNKKAVPFGKRMTNNGKTIFGHKFNPLYHTNSEHDYLVSGDLEYEQVTGVDKVYEILTMPGQNKVLGHKYLIKKEDSPLSSYITNELPNYLDCLSFEKDDKFACKEPFVTSTPDERKCAKDILGNKIDLDSCLYVDNIKDSLNRVECDSFNVLGYFSQPTKVTIKDLDGEFSVTLQGIKKIKVASSIHTDFQSLYLGEEPTASKTFEQMLEKLNPSSVLTSIWHQMWKYPYLRLSIPSTIGILLLCIALTFCALLHFKGTTSGELCCWLLCQRCKEKKEAENVREDQQQRYSTEPAQDLIVRTAEEAAPLVASLIQGTRQERESRRKRSRVIRLVPYSQSHSAAAAPPNPSAPTQGQQDMLFMQEMHTYSDVEGPSGPALSTSTARSAPLL